MSVIYTENGQFLAKWGLNLSYGEQRPWVGIKNRTLTRSDSTNVAGQFQPGTYRASVTASNFGHTPSLHTKVSLCTPKLWDVNLDATPNTSATRCVAMPTTDVPLFPGEPLNASTQVVVTGARDAQEISTERKTVYLTGTIAYGDTVDRLEHTTTFCFKYSLRGCKPGDAACDPFVHCRNGNNAD